MKKYKWNNACPCAGGDWPLKPRGLHGSILRRHPSWRSPEGGWGPSRAHQLSSSRFTYNHLPITIAHTWPVTYFLTGPWQVRREIQLLWCCKWRSTAVCFLLLHMRSISEKEAKPLWLKDGSLLGSQGKSSAENSCCVASLPFPHAGNSAFQFSPCCAFEACELQPWQAKLCK